MWYILPPGGRVVIGRRRRSGGRDTTYLALPSAEQPIMLLPLGMPYASTYALSNFTFPKTALRRARRSVATLLIERRLFPPLGPTLTVQHEGDDPRPSVVAAAERLGVPHDVAFFAFAGGGDALARGVFFLFPPGSREPTWVSKFARVRGYTAPFDADERGLELARCSGATAALHAPRFVGRFDVDGFTASLESAARGKPLGALLGAHGLSAANRRRIEQIGEWVVDWNIGNRMRPSEAAAERMRLAELATATNVADGDEILASLENVPGVVVHNDLGCWNIIVDDQSFTAVDWESARAVGMPLWDLWYFVADAAATSENVPRAERAGHLAGVFRGEHALSPLLFRLTRRLVSALQIDPASVGRIATLCWLHHSRSHIARARALRAHGFDATADFRWPSPEEWLRDERLGLGWQAWKGAT